MSGQNAKLPTSELPGIIAGARSRKGNQCIALLDMINQHRQALGEESEKLEVSHESTSEAIVARWNVLATMERVDAERAAKKVAERAAKMQQARAPMTQKLQLGKR